MNQDPHNFNVIVVGAGPAGLMAAVCAAREGRRVLVVEQRSEAGTRLLATGGGHCNFTNTLRSAEFIRRFGAKSRFVTPALRAMTNERLRLFFQELGVKSHSPDGFHVLPSSDSARSVRDALLRACRQQSDSSQCEVYQRKATDGALLAGVTFRFNTRVDDLRFHQGSPIELITSEFATDGLHPKSPLNGTILEGETFSAERVILAAGGATYPILGGGDRGYRLARKAGHTIVPPCPALVPLVTREDWPGTLSGLTLPHVALRMGNPDVPRASEIETGSLLFTHRGISGPVTLNISGRVARGLMTDECVTVLIDLLPEQTSEEWHRKIELARKEHGIKAVLSILRSMLPATLAKVVFDLSGLPSTIRIAELSRTASNALFLKIKALPLTITRTEGFGKAMVANGGVQLDEVNSKTLESKLVRGLFFAGEILDVDGPCGGFNLQWAFSSGFLAAQVFRQ